MFLGGILNGLFLVWHLYVVAKTDGFRPVVNLGASERSVVRSPDEGSVDASRPPSGVAVVDAHSLAPRSREDPQLLMLLRQVCDARAAEGVSLRRRIAELYHKAGDVVGAFSLNSALSEVLADPAMPTEERRRLFDSLRHLAIRGGPEAVGGLRQALAGSLLVAPRLPAQPAVRVPRYDIPKGAEPIGRSVGAMSRAEAFARRHQLNTESPTTRQLLNHLDETVDQFCRMYRSGKIRRELPTDVLDKTVEEALRSGTSKMRKLLTDGRFSK